MTKRKSKRKLRKETKILAFAILFLVLLIAGLVIFQIVSEKNKQGRDIVIVLDNAHGGDASGIQGVVSEDEYNEKVIDLLYAKLENVPGYRVIRTHQDGQAMAVSTRVQVINDAHADLVLSVRCHDGMSPNVKQTMIYAQPATFKTHGDSIAFARLIEEGFGSLSVPCFSGYFYNHPIKAGYYQERIVGLDDETDYGEETYELMGANAPVVIVSSFNVNSQEEADIWTSEEGYENAVEVYNKAIRNMFK